jgi:hypothetical protein
MISSETPSKWDENEDENESENYASGLRRVES